MSQVRFKITNTDPVTGKRMIAELTNISIGRFGYPLFVQYIVTLKETDETTDAAPINATERAKRAVSQYEETFNINDRKIDSVTKLYLPDNTTNPNAILLAEYFRKKVITSFPGVAGGDQFATLSRGVLREAIAIQQANSEQPS